MNDFPMVGRERASHLDGLLSLFILQLPDAERVITFFDNQTR